MIKIYQKRHFVDEKKGEMKNSFSAKQITLFKIALRQAYRIYK